MNKLTFLTWILPLIAGVIFGLVDYCLIAQNGDTSSHNFIMAVVVHIIAFVIVYVVGVFKTKLADFYLLVIFVASFITACVYGEDVFDERFEKSSYTVQAVINNKYSCWKRSGGTSRTFLMFELSFKNKDGNGVVKEREMLQEIYDKYETGDTILIKYSDRYPDYFEVVR